MTGAFLALLAATFAQPAAPQAKPSPMARATATVTILDLRRIRIGQPGANDRTAGTVTRPARPDLVEFQ
jgi:hypothetical protein